MDGAKIVHELTEIFLPKMFDQKQRVLRRYSEFRGIALCKETQDYVNELVYIRCT